MTTIDAARETPATTKERDQLWRQAAVLLRALLPRATDAESAFADLVSRIGSLQTANVRDIALLKLARDVASEHRRKSPHNSFSNDLFRQLANSAPTSTELASNRPQRLAAIVNQLPSGEKDLLRRKYALAQTAEQIAVAESRLANAVTRDLANLRGTLVNALLESLPDGNPPPPGGASDLGRLADQLLDGTITNDSLLVLETLLLADAAAQAHYHRHVALAVELEWLFRGAPKFPEPVTAITPRKLTRRELVVTGAFILTCIAAAVFITLWLTGRLRF